MDHVHIHALPRRKDDINGFVEWIAGATVVEWNLKKMCLALRPKFEVLKKKMEQEKSAGCKTLKEELRAERKSE